MLCPLPLFIIRRYFLADSASASPSYFRTPKPVAHQQRVKMPDGSAIFEVDNTLQWLAMDLSNRVAELLASKVSVEPDDIAHVVLGVSRLHTMVMERFNEEDKRPTG